jgi:hypothetical protein
MKDPPTVQEVQMRRPVALSLVFLLAGCWPFGNRGGGFGPNDLVICVQNELAAYGNVIARAGGARYDVMPGETVCRRVISADARLVLTARTTGGGARGPLQFAEPLPSAGPGCWLWRLGPGQGSVTLPMDCLEAQQIGR